MKLSSIYRIIPLLRSNPLLKMLTCAVLFFTIHKANAQSTLLEGIIQDEKTALALEGASVSVYNAADSSLVTGVAATKDGTFVISKLNNGKYYLLIKSVGYQAKKITDIDLTNRRIANIGIIVLHPAENIIQAVTVSASRLFTQNLFDKQVYSAAQFVNAKGGTATDVLKNLPAVSVNSLGEISVRGVTGFQIQLNGKNIRADIESILGQIPANSIERIALITAPSAKYDADGKAGIINIITKKGVGDGLAFTANVQGGLPAIHRYNNRTFPLRFGGDVAVNYQQNKWDISASLNYLRNDAAGYREGDANTTNNRIVTSFPSNGERSFKRYTYGARANATYNANKNNSLSIGIYAAKKFQGRTADLLYNNSRNDVVSNTVINQTTYFNSNLQTKEANFYLGSFDYTHSFHNKSLLTFSFLYEYDDLFGNTKNRNLYYPTVTDTIQYTYNTSANPLNGYRTSLSYAYKIGALHMESGYMYRHDRQDGKYVYFINVPHTSNYVIDPSFTSGVLTINQIHAIYTQLDGQTKRLQYSAGLRYEYSHRELSFTNNVAQGNTLSLNNLFPSANISYTLKDKWKIKSAFSRRIQRTNNFELNPFPEREHSETLEQGDANLLPEFTSIVESGTIKEYKGGSFFATLYYQQTKNKIQRVNSVYNDTILNRIYTNAGTAKQWGAEAGAAFTSLKWWKVYLGANMYCYRIGGALFHNTIPVDNKSWVYSLKANLDFIISSTFSAQLNVSYLSKRATAQGEDSYFFSPNSSIKKTFLKGRMAAVVQWQNMDLGLHITNRQRISTWGENFYTTTNYIVESDVLLLNLSFSLKRTNKKIKLPVSEWGENEF